MWGCAEMSVEVKTRSGHLKQFWRGHGSARLICDGGGEREGGPAAVKNRNLRIWSSSNGNHVLITFKDDDGQVFSTSLVWATLP